MVVTGRRRRDAYSQRTDLDEFYRKRDFLAVLTKSGLCGIGPHVSTIDQVDTTGRRKCVFQLRGAFNSST